MTRQIAIRIPDDLAEDLARLVEEGEYPTTADAVRDALRRLTEQRRRRAFDDAIVAGYRRQPPTPVEEAWAERAGRDLVAEEPW